MRVDDNAIVIYNLKTMIIIKYLVYSITIAISSWIVGMMLNSVLRKKEYYNKLSNLNLIKNGSINKRMGLGVFKWVVKNTFFKYFNQNLTLKNKIDIAQLNQLRTEMTFSEISHLIGFGFMAIVAFTQFIYDNHAFGLIIMIVNICMNLYPSLLQQENKKRIDRLIKNYS